MEIEFSFEDDGSAGIWRFTCSCGFLFPQQGTGIVEDRDVIQCPECHRKYRFIWKGMTVEEVK